MPWLDRPDGASLKYELFGDAAAPRVIILNPSNTPLADLRPLLSGRAAIAKLDGEYLCLGFDYRGIGDSSKPTVTWPAPSMSVYVDDVLALLQQVGWTKAHIVGFSFGAAVAQELLLRRTSNFTAERVLLGCPAMDVDEYGVGNGSVPLHALLDLDADERSRKMLLLADTRRDNYWLMSEIGSAGMHYLDNVESRLASTPGALEGRAYQYKARAGHASIARLRELSALGAEGAETPLAPAAAPTTATESGRLLTPGSPALRSDAAMPYTACLILGAVHDGISPPSGLRRLHSALPGSELLWFVAGHWPNLARECASDFGSATTSFLAGRPIPQRLRDASSSAAEEIRSADPSICTACLEGPGGGCIIL